MEPKYVQDYWAAQGWMFIHWGLPFFLVLAFIGTWIAIKQYVEDEKEAKDEDGFKNAGKTLGL